MSSEKNHEEAVRWLNTARDDFETARVLMNNDRYAASCFHSQQAGEKALKSLCHEYGLDPWGHSLVKLLDELKTIAAMATDATTVRKAAMTLDRFYIPTRYPDGLPDITPMEAFSDVDAQTALDLASKFLDLTELKVRGNQ